MRRGLPGGTPVSPSLFVQELESRVRSGGLLGYGVRWDEERRVWRVRNELTGVWATSGPHGSVGAWTDFQEAHAAHRAHQPPAGRSGWFEW